MPGLEKILRGIKKYEETVKPAMVETFQRIRDNPEPKAVMFSCMDSRIILTRILQSDVGDHFLVRNAGNIVPNHSKVNYQSMTTEPGALELGCITNNIEHVIVCGHSDCKAMNGLFGLKEQIRDGKLSEGTPLQLWLKLHGSLTVAKYDEWVAGGRTTVAFPLLEALKEASNELPPHEAASLQEKCKALEEEGKAGTLNAFIDPKEKFAEVDKFSQINTLQQLSNIASHPILREKLAEGQVILNAFWFDVYTGDFYMYSRDKQAFVDVGENYDQLLSESATSSH